MIFGNGIDIIEIERIKKIVDKRPQFLDKYFTENEIIFFKSKKNPLESISGYYCAKEAAVKSFGIGFREIRLKDIEVLKDKYNKPYIILHRKAAEFAKEMGINHLYLSISHSDNYAVASVIACQ